MLALYNPAARSKVMDPLNGQKHSIEYSTTEVPSHAGALVYIAMSLVVVASRSQL